MMPKVLSVFFVALFLCSNPITVAAEGGPTPEDVTFVQGLLIRFGYDPGPMDGICGDRTAAAVRAFHEARSLPLEPGDVEPQAATIVENLTTAFADHIMRPKTAAQIYHEALAGDADAALDVGMMYDRGKSVAADKMLAYTWWMVAETHGNSDATKLKNEMAARDELTEHEKGYATALAEQICDSVSDNTAGYPSKIESEALKIEATM